MSHQTCPDFHLRFFQLLVLCSVCFVRESGHKFKGEKMLRCYVCGSPEVVTLHPEPLCKWHETVPEIPLASQIGEEEKIKDWDDIPDYLQDLDLPVYPV